MSASSPSEVPGTSGSSLFGTDGVRGHPGEGLLSLERLRGIVAATALLLEDSGRFPADFAGTRGREVLIGRDTRASGEEIEATLADAFRRHGFDVVQLGVLPTPGVALSTAQWPEAVLGVVISASHNPAEYNGIKFIAPTGAKISPDFEKAVSDVYWRGDAASEARTRGKLSPRADRAAQAYVEHLVRACRRPERLQGVKIVLDTANGATFQVAPRVFEGLGLHVETIACEPDGDNINQACGALHPDRVANEVVSRGAKLGFCFDGDGDRMASATASGKVLNGDHVLYLSGRSYQAAQKLPSRTVVGTVMANLGLELALRREGVLLLRTDVGDRNVYAEMVNGSHPVGGEQSGHIIYLEYARTGDGILAALRCLDMLEDDALDLERETAAMEPCPQILQNLRVAEKKPLKELPALTAAVAGAERTLGNEGRILLRYSGTEPLLRVMIEGPEQGLIETMASDLCAAARQGLGE